MSWMCVASAKKDLQISPELFIINFVCNVFDLLEWQCSMECMHPLRGHRVRLHPPLHAIINSVAFK